MTLSPTLSTVEVIPAAGGNLPDQVAAAKLRVRVRTEENTVPARTVQVRVSTLASVGQQLIDHEHTYRNSQGAIISGLTMSYADATGLVEIPVRAGAEGTTRYLIELGEDDGAIDGQFTSLNGLIAKPGVDIAAGRTATNSFTATYSSPVTIDEAWLTTNAPTRVVNNVLFATTVTLAYDSAAGDVTFEQCVFAAATTNANSLVTDNHRFTARFCGFRGSSTACVSGPGGTFDRCAFDAIGRDAVHIQQSGTFLSTVGLPDDYTATRFLSCTFKRIGILAPAYAIRGTPMRNVTVDHCVFDLSGAGGTVPQAVGSVLAAIRQVTDADGARGPFVYGSWIAGGVNAFVECVTGTSTLQAQFFTVRGCRFASLAGYGSPGCTYVINQGTSTSSIGNMDDLSGRLISNAAFPAVNTTAGPLYLWTPQVAMTEQPEITWQNASSGGGGGSGGGPGGGGGTGGGGPILPGVPSTPGTDLLYRVQSKIAQPIGGGGGSRVIRTRKITAPVLPAEPIPLEGGTTAPPEQPLIVEWTTDTAVMAEGSSVVIFAELFTSAGAQPPISRLTGFEVPLTVQYVALGAATAASPEDVVVPATIVFPPGAAIGSVVIQAVDDEIAEGIETFRVRLNSLSGPNSAGETVVLVTPGTALSHDFSIAASDAPGNAVEIFMGLPTQTVNEGQVGFTNVNIPVRISGNPSAPVIARTTLTGTATLGPGPGTDYIILNPTVPGVPNAVQFQFQPTTTGSTPQDLNVTVRVFGDTTFEPNETIIGTLTCLSDPSIAVVGASNTTTITIDNDDPAPGTPPRIGWNETSLSLFEGQGTSQVTNRIVELASNNGFAFEAARPVFVEVVQLQAELGLDFEVYWNPPSPGTMVGFVGQVPFAANSTSAAVQIRIQPDAEPEGDETFVLRILPGQGYTVDDTRNELIVTIKDPLQFDSQIFTSRLSATVPTLVTSTVYVADVDVNDGFSMVGPSGSTDCQWHPLSYKPDGTPDSVRVWGLLPPSGRSLPGGAEAINLRQGATVLPTPPINITTQLNEVVAGGLKLTLNHDVNGETRDFSLPIDPVSAQFSTLIDTGNVALQGDGPRLFGRHRMAGRLAAPSASDVSLDYCTVARVYLDCRADLDVVVVAVNWGNYRWAKPDGTFTHYTANPHVDGEVYFKHLWLEGIPAGWAARLLDPDTTRTQYDAGNSRVEIIRPLGGVQRHYLPPLRGHIAYIALYKTATVTATLADEVLRQYDNGYTVGSLGMDRNDLVGEHGLPVLNYGEGSVLFRNRNQEGVPVRSGWDGSEDFAKSERDRLRTFIATGVGDKGGISPGRVGWWNGLDFPEGGAPSGSRVTMSGGTTPGKWQFERNALEMVHLWHRVGGSCWDAKGVSATDEDWCVPSGNTYLAATATWMGIGAQRMAHQHFYVPDFEDQGSGRVATGLLLGPGRKRARGSVQLLQLPVAGDDVVIADGVNAARTFRFGTGTDTATLKHVAIATSTGSTLENLKTVIRASEGPTTLAIHAFSRQVNFSSVDLIARFSGTTPNVTITTTAPSTRIVVTGMSGGSNGTNVRPWNYLVQGTNTSSYTVVSANRGIDIQTAWHNRGMNVESSFHAFDWPHMSRMHRVLREGWWLHFDPIAYDISTDLMHLATQCLQRYTIDPNSAWFSATGGDAQLISSCASSNLRWILDGHSRRMLKEYTLRGFDGDRPSSVIADYQARAFAVHDGLNCGTWIVVNPFASPSAANPNLSLSSNYILVGDWPIERGWGWIVAAFARGYAIDPALRPTSTKDVQRLRLHPGESAAPATQNRPSWTEMVREVVRLTMHRSGAASSQEKNATQSLYTGTGLGDPDFTLGVGKMPGGPQNEPIAGQEQFDDEWYANVIAWHNCYIASGFYAALRRVYSWTDRTTTPTANNWLTTMRPIWRFGLLAMLAARAKMGPTRFIIPSFHLIGAGDPSQAGTAQSVGVFGRFNPENGTANPELTFRSQGDKVWWWALPGTVGSFNYYVNQYVLWSHHLLRIYNDTESLSIFPGLFGVGGGSTAVGAQAVVSQLMADWDSNVFAPTERFGEFGDQVHWIVQWARNELGAS